MHFAHLVNTLLKDEKSERNFAKYSPIKKLLTDSTINFS